MIGGRYPFLDWLVDAMAFLALIGLLYALDALTRAGLSKFVAKAHPRIQSPIVLAGRVAMLLAVAFPFLLATLQIHPQRVRTLGSPAEIKLPYEEVTLLSRGNRLQAWHCPQSGDSAPSAVFVAHGLNANRENFLEPVRLLRGLGHHVLIMDFPAHGDSEGRSTTLGMMESKDVLAAHAWLKDRHPDLPIHALGYSMGGSAVLRAVARHGIFDKVVIDATFTSVHDMAEGQVLHWLGPLRRPVWQAGCFWIQCWTGADLNQHRPVDDVRSIDPAKLLLVHGTDDHVIPVAHGRALHEATGGHAVFHMVDGYGHTETIHHPDYATWLDEFFKP